MRRMPAGDATPGLLNLNGAFLRRTDWSATNLERASFAGADLQGADFRGANMQDTNLKGTTLKGADLREAKNLTAEQVASAIIDETTLLPDYLQHLASARADEDAEQRA